MLTFVGTCDTCSCYVSSWVGWGGVGDVDVRENKTALIHTGGVDSMWRPSKSAIPSSRATRVNGHVNLKLMRSIRIWQWRWMNSKENALEKIGRMLDKRMCS